MCSVVNEIKLEEGDNKKKVLGSPLLQQKW